MVPPGGPAAIYGFLSQIVRTLEWALKIDLQAPEGNETNVTIIAEPPGGDVDIHFPQSRLVQQFKVRDGSWSLTDIVEKTFPDLYRAITDEQRNVRYEFVTNGRIGEWAAAYEFFRSLSSRAPGTVLLESLDATDKRFAWRDQLYSEQSLFEEITRILRTHKPAKDEEEATTHRKLWHLLSHFEFVPTGNLTESEENVRRFVSAYVADDALLEDKVARLRDTVLGYAASGNRGFTPEELLRDADIEGVAFTKLPRAREAVRELTLADMHRLIGYDRALSVRSPHRWPDGNRILGFAGESGQGKSWSLADLAYDLMEIDRTGMVVFVHASGNLAADLTTAVQRIVRDALGHNTAATFEQLVTHIRKTLPDLGDRWLTVCLDDVRLSEEVIEVCNARLDKWGIRVALTAGPRLARHEELAKRNARIEAVRDFSESELREFLLRHGRSWAAIPPDVRKTMRRPLLAAIYVREAAQWSPKTEYELYDACWRRLSTVREQPEHPDDVTAMLALAEDFAGGGRYPWTRKKLKDLKIDGAQQTRLEAIGWLRTDEHGEASIWHDRLLNWAVAENIAQEVREIADDAPSIATLLKRFSDEAEGSSGERPRLTYVPMDVIWMSAARSILSPIQLAAVIQRLEPSHFSEAREIYRLLATAGPVIVPAFAERLRMIDPDDEDRHGLELNIGAAILSALRMDRPNASPHVLALLQDSLPVLTDIGVRAARELPAAPYAPILWKMLREHDAATAKSLRSRTERARLHRALVASVAHAHEWLEEKILAIEKPHRDAVTLAWLLSSLEDERGRQLWLKLKNKLFEATPPEKPGGLIICIRNYYDADEVPRLEGWLTMTQDFAAPSALGALAVVSPDKALEFVKTGDSSIVSSFASWWLPWLMLTRPEETRAIARARLAHDSSVTDWFLENEHDLDAVTIDSFIAHLSGQLQHFLGAPHSVPEQYFSRAAHLLRRAGHTLGVDRLRAQAGTEFERSVVAAIGHLPLQEMTLLRSPSENLRIILRRVSEKAAIEALITALKGSEITETEIAWTVAYPTAEMREALRELITRNAATWDKEDIPDSAIHAVRALALIGDDEGVIDAIWMFGPNIVDDDIPWLMGNREPMDVTLVARLLDALSSDDETQRTRAVEGLRISRRRDLIPRILEQAAVPGTSLPLRYHAIRAARGLVKRGEEIAQYAESIVHGDCDDVRHVLAELLLTSGTPSSMDLLAVLARKLPWNHVRDEATIEQLVDESERGKEMAALLRSQLFPFPHVSMLESGADAWIRLFPVVADDELRQRALDSALIDCPSINPLVVIECVASFDPGAAFDLVVALLKTDRKGREVLPPYLLKFDRNRVVEAVIIHLRDESVAVVRWKICRVLRWSNDESLSARIREMAGDPLTAAREAAYDYSGWRDDVLSDDELRTAALGDESYTVRIAARDALRRRHRIRQTVELRERLIASSGSDAWMYAEALTTYGDPHLLAENGDEICIWPALKTFPSALRDQVAKWLERRSKEMVREAESEDFLRGRSDR